MPKSLSMARDWVASLDYFLPSSIGKVCSSINKGRYVEINHNNLLDHPVSE